MTETMLELLREVRDGLAPSLAGLSEDDPTAALEWVASELRDYLSRISTALWEANDGDDAH